ncbi:prostacyclin receptor isoform X1 [Mugil cephalus]|uniref:prostacyclin receptor isoform X1 n=1 Tax=Mugil cephalus TaxID=48193 RepID=UPI001FB64DFC|nr:prostacyclin receptor isoform X1 [Mugil cephalus]
MQCNSSVSAPFTNYSGGLEGKPVTTTIMFLAGVVGNLLALFILGVHQKENRARSSVFCILVTGLALTDLLGTCILSPPVFICYAKNRTLIQLGGETLCNLFGFAMSFFGLAPTLILCAMAVERCLAISHPYFYSVHIRRSFAKFTLFFIYLFSLAFCLLPFTGYGKFRMYCPGTWCFIRMDPREDDQTNLVLAFSLSYSSLMALLIFAVFVCNGSVIVSLCQMHRSQIMRRSSVGSTGRKKRLSLARFGRGEEEVDHLVLLVLITVIFVVCSLPLTIAGFINAIHPFCSDDANLTAFRFYAVNPIVDPWVFIICRKSVFRHLCSVLSCRFSKGAVKTTTHCTLSLPLDNVIRCNPREVTVPQSNMYPSVPL